MVNVNYKEWPNVAICVILIKSQVLELVSSLQYWAKNMLEMFVMHQTSIWWNFGLMALRIQKK